MAFSSDASKPALAPRSFQCPFKPTLRTASDLVAVVIPWVTTNIFEFVIPVCVCEFLYVHFISTDSIVAVVFILLNDCSVSRHQIVLGLRRDRSLLLMLLHCSNVILMQTVENWTECLSHPCDCYHKCLICQYYDTIIHLAVSNMSILWHNNPFSKPCRQ